MLHNDKYSIERKLWLVEHPIYRYNECVKTLARQHNVRVLDSRLYPDGIKAELAATGMPQLTLKEQYAPAPKPKKEVKKAAEAEE